MRAIQRFVVSAVFGLLIPLLSRADIGSVDIIISALSTPSVVQMEGTTEVAPFIRTGFAVF